MPRTVARNSAPEIISFADVARTDAIAVERNSAPEIISSAERWAAWNRLLHSRDAALKDSMDGETPDGRNSANLIQQQ